MRNMHVMLYAKYQNAKYANAKICDTDNMQKNMQNHIIIRQNM